MRAVWCFVCGSLLLAPAGGFAASPGDPVTLLTEIRPGHGEVRVKLSTESEWKAPLPLLSLRQGDQVRVTRNATAVLMFMGGQGIVTVAASNSPYTVQSVAEGGVRGKTAEVVTTVTRILMGKKKDLAYTALATRSAKRPPVILSPRDGKLLGSPALEWTGSDRVRYGVRVFGPQGLIWEQANLPQAPLPYPPNAPLLNPGFVYRWELSTKDFPVQQGRFSILSATDIAGIRETLSALEPGTLPGYPKNTVALMRAGFLFEQELYTEARAELLAALQADPDEPSLHLMLGHVYERTGLPAMAGEEFDEAQYLSTRTP
jgi:hypothetical protein